jgi:hypothetical protein
MHSWSGGPVAIKSVRSMHIPGLRSACARRTAGALPGAQMASPHMPGADHALQDLSLLQDITL